MQSPLTGKLLYVPGYFVAVGVLYLWGYWGSFGINVLQYISLGDAIKLAAYPVASSFIFFIGGILAAEFTSGGRLPEGGGRETPIGKLLNRHRKLIFGTYILLMCLIFTVLYFIDHPQKWFAIAILVSVPVSVALGEVPFIRELIPDESLNRAARYVFVSLPLFSLSYGFNDASAILSSRKYEKISAENLLRDGAGGDAVYKYIGYAGEYYFFITLDNSEVIQVKYETVRQLRLQRVRQ